MAFALNRSLKEPMGDENNVSQLNVLMQLSDNDAALHESLMPLISKDEQQKQELWFSKVNKHIEGCIEDVQARFKSRQCEKQH